MTWIPYSKRPGTPKEGKKPDFRVKYRFFSEKEGGRKTPPFQGYRCDFSYLGDDIEKTGIFMIWPEFEDLDEEVLTTENTPVPYSGTSGMWVVNREPENLSIHKRRIKEGVKGFFMEGSRRVGEVEVIEVIGLLLSS